MQHLLTTGFAAAASCADICYIQNMSDCIFCGIAQGQVKARVVREDDQAIAFRDTKPQAPSHLLVIPKKHISSLEQASSSDASLLGHLLIMAHRVAADENIESGYRVVINNGIGAGQTVFHIHVHVLGGRRLTWPPG
jgi:histidine triad (HIT) family protein